MKEEYWRNKEMTLLDLLDGIMDTGVVITGQLVISIAEIDLIIIDLKLLIATVEKALSKQMITVESTGGEFLVYESDSTGSCPGRTGARKISPHHY